MSSKTNYNPPGLSELSYRIGTHPLFLKRMLGQIRKETITTENGHKVRPLANLRTRDKDDPAIALLDAWAMSLDVLAFYQERIANEGYLKTATERRSVMELARAVGYELSPGMAAGAYLAFIVDDAPGSPDVVKIPAGARIMSVPKQNDAMPLIFETSWAFTARNEWNDIQTIPVVPVPEQIILLEESLTDVDAEESPAWGWDAAALPSEDEILKIDDSGLDAETVKNQINIFKAVADSLPEPAVPDKTGPGSIQECNPSDDLPSTVQSAFDRLDGVNTDLRKGDLIMVKNLMNQWYVSKVRNVEAVHAKNYTSVQWPVPSGCRNMPETSEIYAFRKRVSLFGHNASDWNEFSNKQKLERMLGRKVSSAGFYADKLLTGVSDGRIFANIGGSKWDLFADLSTKTAVTSLTSFHKPVPLLNFLIAYFISPFSGILYLPDDFSYNGRSANNKLRIALLNKLKTIKIGDKTVSQIMTERRRSFFRRWRTKWFPMHDQRHHWWSGIWQCRVHDLAWGMDKIIEDSVKQDSNAETCTISSGSALDELRSIVNSFENKGDYGKKLKEMFDDYEMNLGGGILAAGTAGDGVFFSQDNGKTWSKNNDGLPNADIKGLAYDANGNLFAKTKEDLFLLLYGDKEWETNKSVTVYDCGGDEGSAFTGTKHTLGIGKYTNVGEDLKIAYIDSMKISKGLKVTLYDYDDDKNILRSEVFTENTPTVGVMNNRIDEIIIEKIEANVQFNDDPEHINKLLSDRILNEWPDFAIKEDWLIDLDSDYTDILPDSWAVLVRDDETPALVRLKDVTTVFRRDFGVSGKVTRIKIEPDYDLHPERFSLRDTILYAASEKLKPASSVPSLEQGGGNNRPIIRVNKDALDKIKTEKIEEDEKANETIDALARLDGMEGDIQDALVSDTPEKEEWRSLVNSHVTTAIGLPLNISDLGLKPGQFLSITGQDAEGKKQGEIVIIDEVIEKDETTVLILKEPIQKDYLQGTLSINANVVFATHGETVVDEVLGSGDATLPNQRYMLKRKPLTYISADKSTLEIRVNGVLWDEMVSLYDSDESSKKYMVRIDDNGNTLVIFGDGKNGVRLPSGMENVTATYRIGIGAEDMPEADSLILPANMPMGIRSVSNPVPATGGADPENHEQTRVRLPLMEAPHDRIISLADYENFAAAFPGVEKAQTVRLMVSNLPLVHITIAGELGREVPKNSKIALTLLAAIKKRAIFGQIAQLQSYKPLYFGLEADVFFDPDYIKEDVEKSIRTALLAAFSFEKQELGKNVTASEPIPVVQNVPGVVYVVFKGFSIKNQEITGSLTAHKALWDDKANKIRPAELLLLDAEKSELVLNLECIKCLK